MGDVIKSADTMTQIAEFGCERGRLHRDREGFEYVTDFIKTEQRPVTIRVIPGESPTETEDRFEKTADIELFGIKARKEIKECQGLFIYFTRFVSTAPEFLKAKAEWEKASKELAAKLNQAYTKLEDYCDSHYCRFR